MGKRKEAPGSGGKSKKPSSWSLWASVAVIIAVMAWCSLRADSQRSKASQTDAEPADEAMDGRGSIRERLFSDDGRYHFAKNGDGYQAASGNGSKKNTSRFSTADYWERRYATTSKEHFDWYGTWNSQTQIRLKPHVMTLENGKSWMPAKVQKILNVGCGNSRLAEELVNDGYADVVSIDIAQTVIDRMKEKFNGTGGLSFLQMDATNLTFPDESFDVVFDKGTLDAMYIGAGAVVKLCVHQIFRVLRPGGLFVSLTFGHPNSRKDLNYTSGSETDLSGWNRFRIEPIYADEDQANPAFWMYLMTKPTKPISS